MYFESDQNHQSSATTYKPYDFDINDDGLDNLNRIKMIIELGK